MKKKEDMWKIININKWSDADADKQVELSALHKIYNWLKNKTVVFKNYIAEILEDNEMAILEVGWSSIKVELTKTIKDDKIGVEIISGIDDTGRDINTYEEIERILLEDEEFNKKYFIIYEWDAAVYRKPDRYDRSETKE